MGRFARNNERKIATDNRATVTARQPATEMKYFVLAVAALIGLGIGWLSGKAITSHLSSTAAPSAAVEPAVPATLAEPSESPTPSAEDAEAMNAQAAAPDAAVTQVATDDSPSRVGRRAARHASMRRAGRGNVFVRPFKALRKLRIW